MLANGSIPIIFNKSGDGFIKVDLLLSFLDQTIKELNTAIHPVNSDMDQEELLMTQGAIQMLAKLGYEISELLVFNYDLQSFNEDVRNVEDFLDFTSKE